MADILLQTEYGTWYDFFRPEKEMQQSMEKDFGLSLLTVQDAIDRTHLPKFEHNEGFDFLYLRYYSNSKNESDLTLTEFSQGCGIFLLKDKIITTHFEKANFWQPSLDSLKKQKGNKATPRFIFHQIARQLLNTFSVETAETAKLVDDYEDLLLVIGGSDLKKNIKKLYQLKKRPSICFQILLHTNEALSEYGIFAQHKPLYKDLMELNSSLMNLQRQNTEELKNLFDLTISLSDFRMNEIMKILTIFSAFFLPLTFISGVYGMNFKYMPELGYKWGYFVVLAIMFLTVICIFVWFKRKKYL